jgi:hypothetical protein
MFSLVFADGFTTGGQLALYAIKSCGESSPVRLMVL